MKIDEALGMLHKCALPKLCDYTILQKIESESFYYPAPLIKTRSDDNSKFILFSAPGAVGKTTLAKYIAHHYGGLYWDISTGDISGTAFAGRIAHDIGLENCELQGELYKKLTHGECLFVLDSFDEAALTSRRDGVKDFLIEIGSIMKNAIAPTIILTARTEMARFICSVCDEEKIPLTCFDIDYFQENEALNFICSYLHYNQISIDEKQKANISQYLAQIKAHLDTNANIKFFIGYAQVLSIISRQIEIEYKTDPTLNSLKTIIRPKQSNHLIYDIIQQLLAREQSKLKPFKDSIRDKYVKIHKEDIVDSLYCKDEQLLRLQFLVEAHSVDSIAIDDYGKCDQLLPDDKISYLKLLKDWLPQHVFLHDFEVLPVFGDYLLAESLLNSELSIFEDEYRAKLPTRVFMDCYLSLNNNTVNSEHIYYLDLAFSSQAGAQSTAYCDISSVDDDAIEAAGEPLSLSLSLTAVGEDKANKDLDIHAKINRDESTPICLCRAENISVSVDGKVVLSPSVWNNVTVREASIECDELALDAPEIFFETYGTEENYIIVHQKISRRPGGKLTFRGTKKLKIQLPESTIESYKRQFYEFVPYLHSITSENEDASCCDNIEQFIHALKKVLEQFKVDKYDGDPAKFKEKIDARCHTGCKARVLSFLKDIGLIYEDGIIYKASLQKMDELRISRVAYSHFDYEQLGYAYTEYKKWFARTYNT